MMQPYEEPGPPAGQPEELAVTAEIKNYLLETAKWAKFLGIIGFIFVGLMVLTAFFAGFFFDNLSRHQMANSGTNPAMSGFFSVFMAFYLVALGILYFFPAMYIYQFGVKTITALRQHQQLDFAKAFSRLKSFFKFWGIFTIIMLAFYVLGIVMLVVFGAFMSNLS